MPVKTWDTKADFDGAHRVNDPLNVGQQIGFERRGIFPFVQVEVDRLVAEFGWPTSSSILIVGCGFGWSMEYLQTLGYADVFGTDTSVYIQGAKTEIDPVDGIARALLPDRILDETLLNNGSRRRVITSTIGGGNQFDVVIVERVVTSLTDAESISFTNAARQIARQAAEVIVVETAFQDSGQNPGYNWHTLEEWRAILPAEWKIVQSGGGKRTL